MKGFLKNFFGRQQNSKEEDGKEREKLIKWIEAYTHPSLAEFFNLPSSWEPYSNLIEGDIKDIPTKKLREIFDYIEEDLQSNKVDFTQRWRYLKTYDRVSDSIKLVNALLENEFDLMSRFSRLLFPSRSDLEVALSLIGNYVRGENIDARIFKSLHSRPGSTLPDCLKTLQCTFKDGKLEISNLVKDARERYKKELRKLRMIILIEKNGLHILYQKCRKADEVMFKNLRDLADNRYKKTSEELTKILEELGCQYQEGSAKYTMPQWDFILMNDTFYHDGALYHYNLKKIKPGGIVYENDKLLLSDEIKNLFCKLSPYELEKLKEQKSHIWHEVYNRWESRRSR